MRARSIVTLLLIIGLLPALTGPTTTRAKETSARILVRPDGAHGPLLTYDPAANEPVVTLPAGMLSADGSRFYTVSPHSATATTILTAFEPASGQRIRDIPLDGRWNLGGVSP